jgi:hypothetical protein
MVCDDSNGNSCFGMAARDSGQRRVPEPPDKITGCMLGVVIFLVCPSLIWAVVGHVRAIGVQLIHHYDIVTGIFDNVCFLSYCPYGMMVPRKADA